MYRGRNPRLTLGSHRHRHRIDRIGLSSGPRRAAHTIHHLRWHHLAPLREQAALEPRRLPAEAVVMSMHGRPEPDGVASGHSQQSRKGRVNLAYLSCRARRRVCLRT
jgi:hypothetical protein